MEMFHRPHGVSDPPLKILPPSVDFHTGRPNLAWSEPPASLQLCVSCDSKGAIGVSAFDRLRLATLQPLGDLGPRAAVGGAPPIIQVMTWETKPIKAWSDCRRCCGMIFMYIHSVPPSSPSIVPTRADTSPLSQASMTQDLSTLVAVVQTDTSVDTLLYDCRLIRDNSAQVHRLAVLSWHLREVLAGENSQ